jgi:predicted transcriptional regulator of viral defense system
MPDPTALDHHIGGKPRSRAVDAAIAELAGRQHGVVSRAQLTRLGIGRRAIERRIQARRLHALHRGVYAVGHLALTREGRWLAAVLASGRGAALSHRSAAALWGIRVAASAFVEVTVPVARRGRGGIRVHHTVLPADELTSRDGIPVTTAARTLVDLAAVLTPTRLERAIARAELLRLSDTTSLAALLLRYPRRSGSAALRRLLAAAAQPDVTRSELEDRFLAFLDTHRLPRPETNVLLHLPGRTIEVDCLWRRQRLVVELDGYAAHGTRRAFDVDRARDRALQAAGLRVLRITWRHLAGEPRPLARDLVRLLRQAGA